jgi:acyl carrier protein
MLKEKVFQLISLHVEEYAEGVEIDENTSLVDDLRMDQLDIVELIIELEKNFEVKIPEDLEDAEKVGDLLNFLEGVDGLTIPDEVRLIFQDKSVDTSTIKYDISVDNRYLRSVKSSLKNDELKILEKHDLPDCGTLLIIEGTIEEIKHWCLWNEFDFNEINIRS